MDHQRAEGLWADYDAGRLDRATVRELHEHLKGCELCRSRVRLRKLSQGGRQAMEDRNVASPEIQAQMARNRDLLVKVLILMAFAAFIWHMKR